MQLKHLASFLLLALFVTGAAKANVTDEDFLARKTQSLINLCTTSPQDPLYREAIHFCQGYLVGAYHFHIAETADKPEAKLVCLPNPKPTRNQAIDMFVKWTQQHPEYMNEIPVETEFRFLSQQWPCAK